MNTPVKDWPHKYQLPYTVLLFGSMSVAAIVLMSAVLATVVRIVAPCLSP